MFSCFGLDVFRNWNLGFGVLGFGQAFFMLLATALYTALPYFAPKFRDSCPGGLHKLRALAGSGTVRSSGRSLQTASYGKIMGTSLGAPIIRSTLSYQYHWGVPLVWKTTIRDFVLASKHEDLESDGSAWSAPSPQP